MKKSSTHQLPSKQLLHAIVLVIVVFVVIYLLNQDRRQAQSGTITSQGNFVFGSANGYSQTELFIPSHPDAFIDSKMATLNRLNEYKKYIELTGYKDAYKNGKKCVDEAFFQRGFRPFWYATLFDFNAEVDNGRGRVDFTVSLGARDKTVTEFKLASNLKNAKAQLDHYGYANSTVNTVIAIFYFTTRELQKAKKFIDESGMKAENIVLIDVRKDNKVSASRIRNA